MTPKALRLCIGNVDTGITIRPDGLYPAMWRIIWENGALSPMANITRAKQAVLAYARPRGLGKGAVATWHTLEIPIPPSPAAKRATTVGRDAPEPDRPSRSL